MLLARAALMWTLFPALAAAEVAHEGQLISLTPGDVACYADIEVDGELRNEMADFSICEQGEAWLGQPVLYAWTEAQVLAADCQGDMDCGRSDTVTLIDRMMRKPGAPACAAEEETVFACTLGGKRVAVCAAADAAATGGWLQYRYGRAGQAPEMLAPALPVDPAHAAEGRVESYAGGGASWLRFRHGDHAYVVYTGVGRWGENGATREQSGIVVEREGEAIADLRCSGPVRSLLGPEWFERVGVSADEDAEFEIPVD